MNASSKRTSQEEGYSGHRNVKKFVHEKEGKKEGEEVVMSLNKEKEEGNKGKTFANITLCLMGMSSVLLYNCVLNTTPHIHELLNRNIVVSSTFFLYFSVLVFISLISSLFIEVKTRTYDICFVISFILQLLYPLVVKYYYDKTVIFYLLIGFIGATCSMMKTMIFSIASIVLNSSKVICLSYGLTGIYSLFITSTFFYFLVKIDKDVNKLMQSILVTSLINCTFIFVSFVCYCILKSTDDFKRNFKKYNDEKEEKRRTSSISILTSENGATSKGPSFSIEVADFPTRDSQNGRQNQNSTEISSNYSNENRANNTTENVANNTTRENLTASSTPMSKRKNNYETENVISIKAENDNNTQVKGKRNKSHFFRNFFLFNVDRKNIMKQARIKAFLYKKSLIFLFCTFYNIFLKIAVFPVVCPEMWTKNVDERYILIGMVQLADCISRIFPTFAEAIPIFKIFLLPQRRVLIYSLARTFLSLLCLLIPLTDMPLLQNFAFKCVLIFSNIYLNGWFVVLSFINISDVLKPLNSMSNVAMVSSFGSTLLRVGLLTGYGASTIYKYFVTAANK
ncbi:nucleoside transporter 2 [Plasmodium gonderi]|uniref:Nucleoside transporter 2 n=1 Tax=Plasmodium gonderi TaxID=77519 RepID=A0A1Y1JAV3_PLAGO|nr:nucleoside transporter 2 [Plasmodium gonderi]GAW79661.1 nucleoside transporter 2 [Plasmodium gonderi]